MRLRPGTVHDLPALRALWAHEVQRRARDCVPSEAVIARMMTAFDWDARSRMMEDADGLRAAGLVLEHSTRDASVVRVETAARNETDRLRLIEWGLGLGRAAGGRVAQVWRSKGQDHGMARLGLSLARPFWRMDRADLLDVPDSPLPRGYRLTPVTDRRTAAMVFNRSFAEHWRFQPLDVEHLPPSTRPPDLELLAVTDRGAPAAVVWCAVDTHDPDPRPQPVGLVEVVGTLPEHRGRGLASALTAEALRRLRAHGARTASLYVDGLNATRAYRVYERLGFSVAFRYAIFEAILW